MARSTVIVATLPKELGSVIRKLQDDYHEHFNSPNVPWLPPHVTLIEPIPEPLLFDELERISRLPFTPCRVRCKNYQVLSSAVGEWNEIYIGLECPELYHARNRVLGAIPQLIPLMGEMPILRLTIAQRVPYVMTMNALARFKRMYQPSGEWLADQLAIFQRASSRTPWCRMRLHATTAPNPST